MPSNIAPRCCAGNAERAGDAAAKAAVPTRRKPATLKNPMPDNTEPPLAPVYIAANLAEAERVEQLFAREGIDFEIRPEASLHSAGDGTCLLGLLFEVPAGQAQRCRHVLASIGLARGVVL